MGASFVLPTCTVTVAVSLSSPSVTVYVKLSVPTKLGAGVYVTVVPSVAAVPFAGGETSVTVRSSPSTSVSLASTGIVAGVSSVVVMASSWAMGASLTGVTVTVTVAVAVPPSPSLTV